MTRVVRKAQDVDLSNLATKADLAALELRLAELKAELLKWLLGSIGIQTVVIIGALLALVRSSAQG